MAKIAQEMAAKTIEREIKFWAFSVKANEIVVRALEQERKCRIALILSSFFFFFFFGYIVFMFWLKWECWNDKIESAWWAVIMGDARCISGGLNEPLDFLIKKYYIYI